jgi:hypothetical protein
MELEFHSTLHSTKGAIKTSTFTPERESITFPLSLIGSTFILLTTPNASQVLPFHPTFCKYGFFLGDSTFGGSTCLHHAPKVQIEMIQDSCPEETVVL